MFIFIAEVINKENYLLLSGITTYIYTVKYNNTTTKTAYRNIFVLSQLHCKLPMSFPLEFLKCYYF